ncbi:MAG: hypothetical protein V4695_12255 [Pseudomonadota bacterium]
MNMNDGSTCLQAMQARNPTTRWSGRAQLLSTTSLTIDALPPP